MRARSDALVFFLLVLLIAVLYGVVIPIDVLVAA